MDINKNEYKIVGIDKTIKLLREHGLKYRRLDFEKENCCYSYNVKDEVVCIVYFNLCGERGKKLKLIKEKFLNYINVRIKEEGVYFIYSYSELDLEKIKDDSSDNINMDNIMEKINKLLALSSSPNEHEAISASMKAQELLAKYNIDVTTIETEKNEEIKECVADVPTGLKWKYMLANVIARSYCCKCYYTGSNMISFYGKVSSAVIARRVFVYLFEIGNKLAKSYEKEQRENNGTAQGIYNSFCSGFVSGIDEQLSKQCTALTLMIPEEVNEAWKEFSEGFGKKNNQINISDIEAYNEGVIEGKRALNAQYIEG